MPPVLASFVVRLHSEGLSEGVVAGEVQVVETGDRIVVTSADDLLLALGCQRAGSGVSATDRSG